MPILRKRNFRRLTSGSWNDETMFGGVYQVQYRGLLEQAQPMPHIDGGVGDGIAGAEKGQAIMTEKDFENTGDELIIWEGPWDMTRRPRPANVPRPRWYPAPPGLKSPPTQQPPPESGPLSNETKGRSD